MVGGRRSNAPARDTANYVKQAEQRGSPDLRRCLLRDQRQKRSRALGFLARRPSRWVILALVGQFLIFVKLVEHDICAPILGMSREVAIYRRIPVLVIATTNRYDLQRTVLLAPLLNQVNCVGKPADE